MFLNQSGSLLPNPSKKAGRGSIRKCAGVLESVYLSIKKQETWTSVLAVPHTLTSWAVQLIYSYSRLVNTTQSLLWISVSKSNMELLSIILCMPGRLHRTPVSLMAAFIRATTGSCVITSRRNEISLYATGVS